MHPKFKQWLKITYKVNDERIDNASAEELNILFKNSPWYGSTANDINWDKRVQVQSLIQKYISHSISSTINLPSTVTEKEVSDIYMNAWKQDIKGITVYRDGSRSGVLISNEDSSKKEQQFEYKDASKRPKCLPVDIFTITSQGSKWNVFVGLVDKKPYEVFATPYFTNKTSMELCKQGKGKYDLINLGEVYSEDITSGMNDEQEVVTRLISTSLRHGTDIKFIVEQLSKTNGDMFTFAKVITRVLKKYIKEGEKSTITCKSCGSSNVIFEEGCSRCLDCGDSKCG